MILWKRLFHNICIDKMKALFPIKKEYVKKIFDGSKAYEYRKSFCSLEVDTNHGKTKSARIQKRNVFSTDKNEM